MRYIDSGSRDPQEALATWLQAELGPSVTELRWQSGYYSGDGLGPFMPTLQRLSNNNQIVHAVIGSNDGVTLEAHVADLVQVLRLPRQHAQLGVASYGAGLFHPKTYHFRRNDGSQAAYVGSANLTPAGIGGQNVEAGLIIDTREGDSPAVLDAVAGSVDSWFTPIRAGLEQILNAADVSRLQQLGLLAVTPPPRPPPVQPPGGAHAGTGAPLPTLKPLVSLPKRVGTAGVAPAVVPGVIAVLPIPVLAAPALPAAVPQHPFPTYVLFAPGQATPTTAATALSGATLPGGYVGLVFRLNQDSARHWRGASGTANISIPVPTVPTLRFGMFQGRYQRPRAEFEFLIRYVYPGGDLRAAPGQTNVMVYGFAPGESGHGDVRLVVSKPPADDIRTRIQGQGRLLPQADDVGVIEWPTMIDPRIRLTLLERNSPLFNQCAGMLAAADAAGQLVGKGACWLPPNVVPVW